TPFRNVAVYDISPDRSQLLAVDSVIAKPFEERQLWVLPLPTGSPRRLSNIEAHSAAWSPDGRIAFAKGSDIFFAKPDGTDVNKLVTVSGLPSRLAFSPDGRRLRFTLLGQDSLSLWEVRTDGSDLHPVLPARRDPPAECCGVWSGDGRYYFFERYNPPVSNIWVLREPTGLFGRRPSEPFQLTTGPMSLDFFTSSPDGKKLYADGSILRGELVVYDLKVHQF